MNNIENFSLFNLQKTYINNQNKNSSINYTLKSLNNAFNITRPIKLNDNINDFDGKIRKINFNNQWKKKLINFINKICI